MQNVKEKKMEAAQSGNVATKEQRSNTFDVKIVSIAGDRLAVTSKAGKNYSYRLANDARITWEGKTGKPTDLKAGSEIRVSTQPDDHSLVIEVESIGQPAKAEGCCS
jgi:hypothetical protein